MKFLRLEKDIMVQCALLLNVSEDTGTIHS